MHWSDNKWDKTCSCIDLPTCIKIGTKWVYGKIIMYDITMESNGLNLLNLVSRNVFEYNIAILDNHARYLSLLLLKLKTLHIYYSDFSTSNTCMSHIFCWINRCCFIGCVFCYHIVTFSYPCECFPEQLQ